ncbi:MAG TPA: hypothetical protein VHB20_09640 [Verrucomicrobiae bacterium]|jgi:hypothetical protein|nr:hypothetical protein [Verrucomicrobiae bacterium]
MKIRILLFTVFFAGIRLAFTQGTFQNLDFEAANVFGAQQSILIPTSKALPGWQAYVGTTLQTQVGYDFISTGAPLISLVDNQAGAPTQGTYGVDIFSAFTTTSTLSQTGLVPLGTESIRLDATEEFSSFTMTLGGQTVNLTALQTVSGHTVYGGNIGQFAGQNETLSITENLPNGLPGQSPSLLQLDNISFSSTTVAPEPSPLILTGIAGAVFAVYWRLMLRKPCHRRSIPS